jgi:hypothetical protein
MSTRSSPSSRICAAVAARPFTKPRDRPGRVDRAPQEASAVVRRSRSFAASQSRAGAWPPRRNTALNSARCRARADHAASGPPRARASAQSMRMDLPCARSRQ